MWGIVALKQAIGRNNRHNSCRGDFISEKEQIEQATAEGFLVLYNEKFSSSYSIKELADAPDVRCTDMTGNSLNLEITLTEDRENDIQAMLGRSKHRDLGVKPLGRGSGIADEVARKLVARIQDKLLKDYGPNTALVIRAVTGVDWDWNRFSDEIAGKFADEPNPYDKGIWIINNAKTRMFQII